MKRVLHLIDTTGPGGAETIFVSLVAGLDATRWQSIPAVFGPGWVQSALEERGFEPLVLATRHSLDFRYAVALRSVMKRHRIDVVQAHLVRTAFYGGMAGRTLGVPVVTTLHGVPDLTMRQIKYHLVRRLVEKVVLVSPPLREEAHRRTPFRESETLVIPNGVDTDRYRPGPTSPPYDALGRGRLLVGAVGNVRVPKDYPTLLRAAAEVERRAPGACRFVVAGKTDAPFFPELLQLRDELGLSDSFEFLGFIDEVESFLRALDVFVLSSIHEGFSLVTVQAMATGLPVAVTRCGGPESIVRGDESGLFVPPSDPRAMASAIVRLVEDEELRRRLGETARNEAVERFSLAAMVRGYQALYEEVLGLDGAAEAEGATGASSTVERSP